VHNVSPRLPSLDEVFSAQVLQPLLGDAEVQRVLLRHLPEGRQTVPELYHVITSPQIRQALVALSQALQSDNFNTVMTNFQLDPMDGAQQLQQGDGIAAFLAALQAQVDKEKNNEEGEDFYS